MIGPFALVACALIAQSGWSAAAGQETFSLRDIARQGPPADASPVEWRGTGPSVLVAYSRENTHRLHRFDGEVAHAASFAYNAPLRQTAASNHDHLLRLEGRYEYRRYLLTDRIVRGLGIGLGAQGLARRISFARDTGAGVHEQVDTSMGIALDLAARWNRSSRWSAEVAWVNGGSVLHQQRSDSVGVKSDGDAWGGGWLTDLNVSGTVRLAAAWLVSAAYLQTGEGTALSHGSYAFGRRRLVAGVSYAR